MHGAIIDVRAERFSDVKAIKCSLGDESEMLLLVRQVMLHSCDDSLILDTDNSGRNQFAGKIRIRTEPFPVTAALCEGAKRANDGP